MKLATETAHVIAWPLFQVTTPYYQALFSWGKDKRSVADFHSGLNMWESELKDRGGLYFGGTVSRVHTLEL